MLLTERVEVKINYKNVEHFRSLGYDAQNGQKVSVLTKDLLDGCKTKVLVRCDFCGKEYEVQYVSYARSIKFDGKNCCVGCKYTHVKQANFKKYGVESTTLIPEVHQKIKQTMIARYGVENYSQAKDYREKYIKTSIERYGTEHPCQSEQIKQKHVETSLKKYGVKNPLEAEFVKEKIRQTNLQKYGTENPSSLDSVKEKTRKTCLKKYGNTSFLHSEIGLVKRNKTCLEKYGTIYPMQNDEYRQKVATTFFNNGSETRTSRQQTYLSNLYKAKELNYPICGYFVDILLEDNVVVEYNGGGHNLSVILGTITQEAFDKRESFRNNVLQENGYKRITIISRKDKLPSDDIFLRMLDDARSFFSEGCLWCNFDIDNSNYNTNKCPKWMPYEYGVLGRLKAC